MALGTLGCGPSRRELLQSLDGDGAVIGSDVAETSVVDALKSELEPFVARAPKGADEFSGVERQRSGALVAQTPLARGFVKDPLVLA
jgi:hypothetical protein